MRACFLLIVLIFGVVASGAPQRILVQWDFQEIWAGQKTNIAPSFVSDSGVTCSSLVERTQGTSNAVGVVKPPSDEEIRVRRLRGSATFSRALAVGLGSTKKETLSADSYSINFNVTMGDDWNAAVLSSLRLDFGYDTALEDYYAPIAQLYVSRDGENWTTMGACVTPEIGAGAVDFANTFYIEASTAISLEPLGVVQAGETLYFRLALGENGEQESDDDNRRIIIDNITLMVPAEGGKPEHLVVYQEAEKFAGWPANNGAWAWGDELLVGFELWGYLERNDNHSIDPDKPSEVVFSRSLDGGRTWTAERHGNMTLSVSSSQLISKTQQDYSNENFAMRLRDGFLWTSNNRGQNWVGPSRISGQQSWTFQARTSYAVTGKDSAWVFMTAKENQGEGDPLKRNRSIVWRTRTGGLTFAYVSMMGDSDMFSEVPEEGDAYSIMPSVVRIGNAHYVAAVRELIRRDKWIQIYESKDDCNSWTPISTIARGAHNPGALLHLGGSRLAMVYGVRETSPMGIYVVLSEDAGRTWCEPIVLRGDAASWDFGYPVAFVRPDGNIVAVYYYTTKQNPEQHIAATIWQPPPRSRPLIKTPEEWLIYAFTDNYSLSEEKTPELSGKTSHLPVAELSENGTLSLSFVPLRGEYLYEVQQSTDLYEWTTISAVLGGNLTKQYIEAEGSSLTQPRLFLRIRVSEPEDVE